MVLSGLCGLATHLAWLDERLFPITWFGLAVWIALTWSQPPHVASRLWMLGGLPGIAVVYYWLPSVAATHLDVSLMTGVALALLSVTWDAFRFGAFGYLVARVQERRSNSLLAWPVVWVALEWIWPHVFPWRLGHTQVGWLPFCQIAEVTGVYGVSFLLMWGAACAAALLRHLQSPTKPIRGLAVQLSLCGFMVLACLTWGTWRMHNIERLEDSCPQLRLALVQPGSLENALEVLGALTRQVEDAHVVIWGESSVSGLASPSQVTTSAGPVEGVLDTRADSKGIDVDLPLLCGGTSLAPDVASSGAQRNTAFLLDADGRVASQYHKRVLMPWGESTVGQHWIPGLRRLLGDRQPMVAGTSAAPLCLRGGARLGVLICYEDLRADAVRQSVRAGAQVLVNLNNLTSFGRTSALFQHQQIARFRAMENRRCLVRCGITGSTAIIAPTGRVELQAPPHVPVAMVGSASLCEAQTLYTRWGDAIPIVSLALVGLILISARGAAEAPGAPPHVANQAW